MDERQKLMLQIRVMRAGIDPKLLAKMQQVAVAFFSPMLEGKAARRPPPAPKALPPAAKKPAMDGRAVALRALEARQRKVGADGFVVPRGDPDGPLVGPDSGGNVQKTIDLYLMELRKSRESAAEIVDRAAAKTSTAEAPKRAEADPKRALSSDEMDEKKRNFLKRWFQK